MNFITYINLNGVLKTAPVSMFDEGWYKTDNRIDEQYLVTSVFIEGLKRKIGGSNDIQLAVINDNNFSGDILSETSYNNASTNFEFYILPEVLNIPVPTPPIVPFKFDTLVRVCESVSLQGFSKITLLCRNQWHLFRSIITDNYIFNPNTGGTYIMNQNERNDFDSVGSIKSGDLYVKYSYDGTTNGLHWITIRHNPRTNIFVLFYDNVLVPLTTVKEIVEPNGFTYHFDGSQYHNMKISLSIQTKPFDTYTLIAP